ncbi:SPOR domain-containing protein [Fundidesulfovibrio soli]|uniref:SPOR domain-containing protein n=1 Tax=Fundidesulfovibrio soli TaxID=2922716 RepID=UPI001FAEFE55
MIPFLRRILPSLAVSAFFFVWTIVLPAGSARAAQQAGQAAAKPAATVLFSGDFGSRRPGPEIAGAPGVRFGIEFRLEGTEPRVLTVRLKRPAPEGAPGEDVWLLAAGPGQPVQAAWEFAFGWEVAPGPWEMKIFSDDVELASSSFQVVQAPEPVKAPPAPEPAPAKDKRAGIADGKKGGKKDAARPDAAKPDAVKPEPARPAEAGPVPKQSAKAAPENPAVPQTAPAPAAAGQKQAPKAEPAPAVPTQAAPDPGRQAQKQSSKPEPAAPGISQATPEPERQGQKQPAKGEPSTPATRQATSTTQKQAPKAEPAKPEPAKQEPVRQEAAKPDPARTGKTTGLAADRRVYVLIAGSFSEQARAMWMAVLVREQGVKACVRSFEKDGRRLWQLVAGWRTTPDEAQAAKAELAVKLGDIIIVPMSAGELEKGLQCR